MDWAASGKTQLAIEYANEHHEDYDIVWWIDAEEVTTLVANLAELAEPLGVLDPGEKVQDLGKVKNVVLAELSKRLKWLLIYDNVESPESLQENFPGGGGHVLITSRHRDWKGIAEPLPVDVMGKTEARKLLLERSEQNDNAAADAIANRVGWLPLASELAGAYCAATGMPLAKYVELLD